MTTPAPVAYLRSLDAVRDRSKQVFDLVVAGKADHWDWHEEKLDDVVEYCLNIIQRDFGTDYDKIPPHCRRNHFGTPGFDRIQTLLQDPRFPKDPLEGAATLIDLYIVSVLLDAGAGPDWAYTEKGEDGKEGWKGGRSEGLAVASWHIFIDGVFSSSKSSPLQVDAAGLKKLTTETLAEHLQVSASNPMAGLDGRCNLLIQLGSALEARPDICPNGRPGDMLAYFKSHLGEASPKLPLTLLWKTLFELLLPIWPARTSLDSYPSDPLGDVWPCPSLERALAQTGAKREEGDDLVAFHKLTQWLCYSLVETIEGEAKWPVDRGQGQTGLPEVSYWAHHPVSSRQYRNGGLLMDLGLITIRPESLPRDAYTNGKDKPPVLQPSHPAVVEWRAVTVMTLDKIHEKICEKLSIGPSQLSLAQVLEAATWKGGREIAKEKRAGGGPPIDIISDGTVF